MKKLKLRTGAKVVLTLLLLILGTVIYSKVSYWGFLARSSDFYMLISIISWLWLIVGQTMTYARIWR